MRSSNRRKNSNISTTNVSANCRELFPNNENRQIIEELVVPILTQNRESEVPTFNTNTNIQDQFIEPVWSSNENINMDISSFVSLVGPTNIVETEVETIRNNTIFNFQTFMGG